MEAWKEEMYLKHHGILGMKWGDRNGPPYPLNGSDHSASEKKAGYRKSLGGGRNEELYGKKKNKAQKIQSKFEKKLSRSHEEDQKMLETFNKGRSRMEEKYDKKISKLEADKKSYDPIKNGLKDKKGNDILTKEDVASMTAALESQIQKLKKEKGDRLKNSNENMKNLRAGQDYYNKVLEDYKNVKIKALEDKLYGSSEEYKKAAAAYVNQTLLSIVNYSSKMTKLGYTYDMANADKPNYRNKYILNDKK